MNSAVLPSVVAVCRSSIHGFRKTPRAAIELRAGLGVEADAHSGSTVQHLSRVARDPSQPNLRQVHLIASELFAELEAQGFQVEPGELGENITTRGIDLLGLSRGTRLRIGASTVLEVTGLRNPCAQIDAFQPGLLGAVLDRDSAGRLIRKAGIMSIVLTDGSVKPEDPIVVEEPGTEFEPLAPV